MKQMVFDSSPMKRRFLAHLFLVIATLLVSSCAQELFRTPVPPELEEVVEVAEMSGVRAWGDSFDQAWQDDVVQSI